MPRAKVVPEDRQRVERACQPCQHSKKRCDGKVPCSLCLKHDRQDSCVYGPSARENTRKAPYPTPQRRQTINDNEVHEPMIAPGISRTYSKNVQGNGDKPKEQQTEYIKKQMMINSKGEKVFLGETSALSFLQFLRQLLRQHMGPSNFTESSSNVMLEAQSPEANPAELVDDIEMQRNFIQYYLAASSGLLALHTHASVDTLVSRVSAFDSRSRLDQAEALLAVAIGAQARNRRMDSNYARAYFDRGRHLSFESMLENPSHALVRLFLLMAFYMLGACQRNAACLYLGIAAKTASIIGLHDESQYPASMDMEQGVRYCTWKSLKVMDTLVNTLLGRPTSFPPPASFLNNGGEHDTRDVETVLDASFEMSTMIEAFTAHASLDGNGSLAAAEMMLQRIRKRMNSFPTGYRSIKVSDLASLRPDELAGMIGNVHLACIYYHAVMLICRPYFMASLVARMRIEHFRNATSKSKLPSEADRMAEACIDAAIFMATMAKGALNAGILLANMVVLKAWLFLSGLILGFAICTQVDERTDVEDAFVNAREVLAMLSISSPQAQEYYDILGLFAEAIRRYREQAAVNRTQKSKRYVDQVLSFDTNDCNDGNNETEPAYLTPTSAQLSTTELRSAEMAYGDMLSNFDPTLGNTTAFADLGQFAAQINDFFPFDYDSLGLGHDQGFL